VERVGLVGSRFGGTVAALTADREDLRHLILIAPILNGSKYVTELLRSRQIVEMLGAPAGAESATTVEQLRAEMLETGLINIKGFALRREVAEELQSVNLMTELERFSGRVLAVQVSRGETIQGSLQKLVARLQNLGATADLEVVSDPFAPHFGYEHFQPVTKDVLGDSLGGVNGALAETVARWAAEGA
jgi:hypothetical protein